MKLRIRGDSIRLRLTQSEVAQVALGEFVTETTNFPGGVKFQYVFEPANGLAEIEASMTDRRMLIRVPMPVATAWAKTDVVEIKYEQAIAGQSEKLFLLIEKDFQCLKTRENENEDESDNFVNPNATRGHC